MATSVSEIITQIQRNAPGWNRTGVRGILPLLDWSQNQLMLHDSQQLVFQNPNNEGFPSFLPTEDNKFEYEMPDETVTLEGIPRQLRYWRIRRVFIDITFYKDYNRKYLGEPFDYYGTNFYTIRTRRVLFAEVPVETRDATDTEKAKVIFRENPALTPAVGTSGYFVEGILEPLPLTSESIPLSIPRKQFEYNLIQGALGRIEDADYGKTDRIDKFFKHYAPQVWAEQNKGAKSSSKFTPVRN